MASTVTAQDGQATEGSANVVEDQDRMVQELIQMMSTGYTQLLDQLYWRHPGWFMDRVHIDPPILLHRKVGPLFISHIMLTFFQMQQKLPREIRDKIWAQVWDEEEIEEYLTHMRNTIQSTCNNCVKPQDLNCPYHLQLPYYLRPDLIGLETARELVESWYSITTTAHDKLLYAFTPASVKNIICNDAFGVGLYPAQFLRKLEINMSVEWFVPPAEAPEEEQKMDDGGIRSAEHRRELITEPLLKIQNKRGFKLTINVYGAMQHIRLNLWKEVFDALREPVRVMMEQGAIVEAIFSYKGDSRSDQQLMGYDILEAMMQPEEQWKADAVACLDAVPSIADIHRLYRDENRPDFNPESHMYLTEEEIEDWYDRERAIDYLEEEKPVPRHKHLREYMLTGTLKHEEGVCRCPECEKRHGRGRFAR